jgi:transposase-like protein
MERRRFTREFKLEAVKLVKDLRMGLIDKVLAPASVKERPVPQWQRQKAKGKVERINPNCQRKDCRSIRRSFCLGGALD